MIHSPLAVLKVEADPDKKTIFISFADKTEISSNNPGISAKEIWQRIEACGLDFTQIDFDLSSVEYLGAAGCGILASLASRAKNSGMILMISGASDEIRNVLEICKFPEIMTIR